MLKMNRSMKYRPEIDGLRAIAVLSVIIYHAEFTFLGIDWATGGYIGVDIFFVISGYLITKLILLELEASNSFSFLNFYERRARRILPMLLTIIVISIPFAWDWMLPSQFVEFCKSVVSSILFSSNFFFYFAQTEYGADSSLMKPFLHTWSLGIEEQFYIVFPIFLILFRRFFKRQMLVFLLALFLLSLGFAEIGSSRNVEHNFYLPLSRFWELLAGAILAYCIAPRFVDTLYLKNEDKEIDMGKPRFTDDFKIDAIKQITERGHSVADVSTRLGVSTHSLYGWIKRYSIPTGSVGKEDQSAEIRRLRQELVRVTEERDILKKATVYFARDANLSTFAVQIVCRSVNEVHLYQGASSRIYSADYVPNAPCSSKWLLCMVKATVQQTRC